MSRDTYTNHDVRLQYRNPRVDLTPTELAIDAEQTAIDNPREFMAGFEAGRALAEKLPWNMRYGGSDAWNGRDYNNILTDPYLKGHAIGQAVRSAQLDIAEGRR